MSTYCSECTKEIKDDEMKFIYHGSYVCWNCNAELSGLSEYMIQLPTNQIPKGNSNDSRSN